MRIAFSLGIALLAGTLAFAQASKEAGPSSPPAEEHKAELKQAAKLYEKAQKLIKDKHLEEAFQVLEHVIELTPKNMEYAATRELVAQQLVTNHIDRGNALLKEGKTVEATAEFRAALHLDPKNEFALQRLQDALPMPTLPADANGSSRMVQVVDNNQPVVLAPSETPHSFHYRGISRNLLEQICSSYGIKANFDESVTGKPVRFEMEDVDFFTAIREASKIAHVFIVPMTSKQVMFANDTQALRRSLERMVARTFYISEITTPQELNDVVNLMRTIFDVRFVSAQATDNSIVVRAPAEIVKAASVLLGNFLSRKPQVNLQVSVYQISHSMTRQIGLELPLSFQAINVTPAILATLGAANNTNLINQLFSSGAINQANSQALQGILAQLQNQNSSVLSQGFATFGGGRSLFGVPIPPATLHLSLNESDVKSLSTINLRTAQGNTATLRLGSRYPIVNASFSPIFNSSALSSVLQNQTYQAPFPSFSYEDLGITIKATPQVLADSSVNLKLEMQIKSLTGQNINGVPVISNREYAATMSVYDGQPSVVAGYITKSEQKSLTGIPGISYVPLLNYATANQNKQIEDDELLIVVTPFIVSPTRQTGSGSEIWLPAM